MELLAMTGVASACNSDDQLTVDVPVTHDWLWVSPDKPLITVDVTNDGTSSTTMKARLEIVTDKQQPCLTLDKQQVVAGGSVAHIDFEPELEPGFYRCTATVNNEDAHTFVIGVDPQDISSPPDYQHDFVSFWQETLSELKAVDGQYTLTEIPEKSTASRKVYLLEMHSLPDPTGNDIIARAFYAEPVDNGTYPAMIQFNAYDNGSGEVKCMGGDDNPGWVELNVSTRGQYINNRPPYSNPYGQWITYGLDSQYNYYYRGAYMDCVRAIDFLGTREKVQQGNIFAQGASQGGALALAATALSGGRINALAMAIPFMGDFPDYSQIVSWPWNLINSKRQQLGMSEQQTYEVLSYFDTKNLATLVTCPAYMLFSLQDDYCPPHTNWAAYNNLASSEKSYSVNPTYGHKPGSSWIPGYKSFFNAHLKEPDAVPTVLAPPAQVQQDPFYYNVMGQPMGKDRPTVAGIYIHQGNKVAVW